MARSRKNLTVVPEAETPREPELPAHPFTEQERVVYGFLVEKLTAAQDGLQRAQTEVQQRNDDLIQHILKAAEAHGVTADKYLFNQDTLSFDPKPAQPEAEAPAEG